MNIKTANRLCELRKAHGLSQEELASKLNVSRQAVSKWERSESSPDTDNLIQLASLYGVTLDELLNGEGTIDLIKENNDSDPVDEKTDQIILNGKHGKSIYISGSGVEINTEDGRVNIEGDDIIIHDEDEVRKYSLKEELKKERKHKKFASAFDGIVALLTVVAFLLLGFLTQNGFTKFWVLFVFMPVIFSIVEIAKTKRVAAFNFPCFVTTIYLSIGVFANIWTPTWVVFILIPVFYIIAKPIDKYSHAEDARLIEHALDKVKINNNED